MRIYYYEKKKLKKKKKPKKVINKDYDIIENVQEIENKQSWTDYFYYMFFKK